MAYYIIMSYFPVVKRKSIVNFFNSEIINGQLDLEQIGDDISFQILLIYLKIYPNEFFYGILDEVQLNFLVDLNRYFVYVQYNDNIQQVSFHKDRINNFDVHLYINVYLDSFF